jgi:hypothetical protein
MSLAALAILLGPGLVAASPVDDLKRDYKCMSVRLTDARQRARMPGDIPEWIVFNEGPAPVSVFEGRKKGPAMAPHGPDDIAMVVGDERHDYFIGLYRQGTALVHICQER